jgi:YD repeat-containing protein
VRIFHHHQFQLKTIDDFILGHPGDRRRSTTSYTYQGNSTTVTDPAGKWKTSTVDAYGNVFVVTEPNPAGGTFTTNYTYTPANQLTGVSMTRGNVTEARTYLYSGSDLGEFHS